MIALGNFLLATANLLHWIIWLFTWLLIARVILSWVSPDPRNPIVQFIYSATEPLLARIRSKIPPMGFLDLSALVVFGLLMFADTFLVDSLADYGRQVHGSAVRAGTP